MAQIETKGKTFNYDSRGTWREKKIKSKKKHIFKKLWKIIVRQNSSKRNWKKKSFRVDIVGNAKMAKGKGKMPRAVRTLNLTLPPTVKNSRKTRVFFFPFWLKNKIRSSR